MGVIPSLGTRVARLLASVPLGSLGVVLEIIPVIGAIVPRLGFGASSEKIGLELAFLAFKLFGLLLQRGDAVEGIAMTILPISDLLTEFEILRSKRWTRARSSPTSRPRPPPEPSDPRRSRSGKRDWGLEQWPERSRRDRVTTQEKAARRESIQVRDGHPEGRETKNRGRAIIHGGRVYPPPLGTARTKDGLTEVLHLNRTSSLPGNELGAFYGKRPPNPFVQCATGYGPAFHGVGLDLCHGR